MPVNKLSAALCLLSLLTVEGCSNNPVIPVETQVVLRGYLYANQPVQDIQLASSVSILSSDTSDPPITNASVVLLKGSSSYQLAPNPAQPGFYYYPGSDLSVDVGDEFQIRVDAEGQVVTAETAVPTKPLGASLSANVMRFQRDTIVTRFGTTRVSVTGLDTETVSWTNSSGDYFYITVESTDSTRQLLRGDSVVTRFLGRFTSEPTNQSSYRVNNNIFQYTGGYLLRLYHVNNEYANLYRSRDQDSRTLNEPLTNVKNGLGVFSAFASDSLSCSVVVQ